MNKVATINEYKNVLRKMNKKQFWGSNDISQVLQVSVQRIHDLNKIYKWELVHENPHLWNKQAVIATISEILTQRVKWTNPGVLKEAELTIFGNLKPEDIDDILSVFG